MLRVVVLIGLLVLCTQAEARPHRHFKRVQLLMAMEAVSDVSERVVGGRPAGCPHAFCGCAASLFRFGRIIPELNLAANWRRFPRSAPASGMAAVRSGHVMILQQHLAGDVWTVYDGNSGGHVTREHARSISGYTVVDPAAGVPAPSGTRTTVADAQASMRSPRINEGGWSVPR